jgi:tetratricopeptide (TPR) repeat protein
MQDTIIYIVEIMFFIGLILFCYFYKKRKLLYVGNLFLLVCLCAVLVYLPIAFRLKKIISPVIFALCSAYVFYSINKYLYSIYDIVITKLLSKILFFNENLKYRLAWIYYKNNDYNKSIEALKNCSKSESYFLLANNYEQINEYDAAIKTYTQILQNTNNERPDILYNRGALYKKIGKYDEAIIDFNNCINCKEPDPKAYIALGVIKDEVGECEEARKLFIKGNALDNSYKEYISEKYK